MPAWPPPPPFTPSPPGHARHAGPSPGPGGRAKGPAAMPAPGCLGPAPPPQPRSTGAASSATPSSVALPLAGWMGASRAALEGVALHELLLPGGGLLWVAAVGGAVPPSSTHL
jgi:hypothetical protein